MHRTWPWLFGTLAAGVGLACYNGWLVIGLAAVLFLAVSTCCTHQRSRLVLMAVALLAGGARYQAAPMALLPTDAPPAAREFRGKIADIPYCNGDKTTFTLETEDVSPYLRRIRVVCLFVPEWRPGDCLSLRGTLRTPSPPGNPGEFDFPVYLAHQGIYYDLDIKAEQDARVLQVSTGPRRAIYDFRHRVEQLTRQVLPPQEAAILLGMLLGGQAGMGEDIYQDFQKTGIVHLFSVGGMHLGFILLLTGWVNSLAHTSRHFRLGSGFMVLLAYGTMIGWPAPVLRSVIMAGLGLLAYYSGREGSLVNALAISGLLLLLIDPHQLFSLSCQLTFLATWGLVYLFPILQGHWFSPHPGRDMILLPLAAELAVLPLVAYHFDLFSPVSILTNILITYLAGAAVILGFISLLLASSLPFLAVLPLYPAGMCIEGILFIVRQVQSIPGGYWWVAPPAMGMILAYYGGLLAACQGLKRHSRLVLIGAVTVILGFVVSLLIPSGWSDRGILEIVFIDVGQGDAILLKSPQGRFVLVDGGGSPLVDVGMKRVLPYLHHRGLNHLDMIINTHPDLDHLQGLEKVAAAMDFGYLGLPATLRGRPEYLTLENTAARANSKVVSLGSGQSISLEEGLSLMVLGPEIPARMETEGKADFNSQSVVMEIRYGAFTALLCGDVPSHEMIRLLASVQRPVTVVKVPHHGSKGSWCPEFYGQLKPRLAILSVGERNPFGHPAPIVLDGLSRLSIPVLRTDQQGALTLRSDGQTWGATAFRNETGF